MGQNSTKVAPLPIPVIVKKIAECHIPDDRNILVDLFDMLDINMCEEKDFEANTRQLKDSNGMNVLLKVLRRMVQDVDLVFVALQLVETIKFNRPIVMDFIQFGGLDFLDRANKAHAEDEFISGSIPPLLKTLVDMGAPLSIEEIRQEEAYLQFCTCCQGAVERMKMKRFAVCTPTVVPKSSERINRVLKFMDNFLVSKEVQMAALDAVIAFARNADAPRSAQETNLVAVSCASLKLHAEVPEIMWRVAMAFSLVAQFSSDLSFEMVKLGAHMIVVSKYAHYKKQRNHQVMQQMLWMMGALLNWPASRQLINRQAECMEFYKCVIDDFDNLKAEMAKDPASKKKGYKDDKLYFVAVPLSIRSFMRETAGRIARQEQKKAEKDAQRPQRRNFDERPKYGTVQDTLLVPGEPGLLATEDEDEEGNAKRKIPDWERKLNAMYS